jgi:hypothetical protein
MTRETRKKVVLVLGIVPWLMIIVGGLMSSYIGVIGVFLTPLVFFIEPFLSKESYVDDRGNTYVNDERIKKD